MIPKFVRMLIVLCTSVCSLAFAEQVPRALFVYNLSDTPHSFSQFTEATGIDVEVLRGDSIEQIKIDNPESANPDLVIESDAINFAELAQKNLLSTIQSNIIAENIPAQFRDLNSGWVGYGFRGRALAYNPKKYTPPSDITYAELAKPEYEGQLCLRKSTYSYSRALIASIIHAEGFDRAFTIIKGWVANNKQPIFKGDMYALKALEKGTCGIAFVNSDYFEKYVSKSITDLKLIWPDQNDRGVHVNVSGLALLKESQQKEIAVQFLEFLAQDEEMHLSFSVIKRSFPTNLKYYQQSEAGRFFGPIKWDPTPLSEIIKLDETSQKLAKDAGYLP
jgi:ABC-type Fe3+ transport system, periplasmic component